MGRTLAHAQTVAAVAAALALACAREEPTEPASRTAPAALEPPDSPSLAALAFAFGRVDNAGGQYTSLVSQAGGRQHISYYDHLRKDLEYATCPATCTNAANWQRVRVDTAGIVGEYTSLAVRDGLRHIAYYDATNSALKYATCASACLTAANWQKVTVDGAGAAQVGQYASIEVGSDGRRHLAYWDGGNRTLKYATCLTSCATAGSWQKATIDPTEFAGQHVSLALGSDGRLHLSHFEGTISGLKYATCPADCAVPANWSSVVVDVSNSAPGAYSSIAVGADGRRHITYRATSNLHSILRYATCLTNCTIGSNWQKLTVDDGGGVSHAGLYTSIAVGANGTRHVSYYDASNRDLKYASCTTNCTLSTGWQKQALDGTGASQDVGLYTSLTFAAGLVHISYFDEGLGDLRYGEVTP